MRAVGEHQDGVDIRRRKQLAEVSGSALDVIPVADARQHLVVDVGDSGYREQIGALGERGQMHHLRDPAAADDSNSQDVFHDGTEKTGDQDCSRSPVLLFQSGRLEGEPHRRAA